MANALIAECIGGKIFSLEKLLNIEPLNATLFGQKGLGLNFTCGVILWPLEFIITDIINEYYGPKAVRLISRVAVALIAYAFLMFYLAIQLPPADFWNGMATDRGISNLNTAFSAVFGQGIWIIIGSIIAFLVSQFLDVYIFHKIKARTGEKMLWLRATGSTVISQIVDSFIVLFIAFYIGSNWSWQQVLAVGLLNYSYKLLIAILLTPLLYFVHKFVVSYVGADVEAQMRRDAMANER